MLCQHLSWVACVVVDGEKGYNIREKGRKRKDIRGKMVGKKTEEKKKWRQKSKAKKNGSLDRQSFCHQGEGSFSQHYYL